MQEKAGKVSVTWRDAMGQAVKDDEKMMVKDTDLVIVGADWSHMGRSATIICSADNHF